MPRCPECWSAVEAEDRECAQCGAALGGRRTGLGAKPLVVVGILAVAALGLTWAMRGDDDDRSAPSDANAPAREPTKANDGGRTHPDPAPDAPGDVASPPVVHWSLRRESDGAVVHAIAVDGGGDERATLLIPLDALPRTGGLVAAGAAIDVDVVNADPQNGYALLLGPRLPSGIDAVTIGPARVGTPVVGIEPARGPARPNVIESRQADRRLALRDPTAAFAALLDDTGIAVAIGAGDRDAIDLGPATLWLGQRIGRPLEDVQAELRAEDPAWLLAEIDELLARDPLTEADARRANELCERVAHMATDREAIESAQSRQRLALHNLVRLESHRDIATAIATARSALASYPDHYGILDDLVRLLAVDDPAAAAPWFRQLAQAPDHDARDAADTLARAFDRHARELHRAGRYPEALALTTTAVELFTQDADLRLAYAHALLAAGNHAAALEQSRLALSLGSRDAADLVDSLTSQDKVVIPFDPRTNVIDTAVSVAGQQVSFVVDTGASTTTIPTATARALGLLSASNPRVQVNTASGTVTGEVVRIPWAEIGPLRLTDVRAVVIDLPGPLAGRGLLGMNALRRFDVKIDGEAGRLTLERRRGR